MSGGMVRVEDEGLANPCYGEFVAARLMGDDAEVVPRVGVVGLDGHDLAVECLGVHEAPGLMVLDGQCEGLLSDHRRQDGFSAHQRCHMAR